MKDKIQEIIKHYGLLPQLKHFNSEVFELNEAIIKFEEAQKNYFEAYDEEDIDKLFEHITEEIADCYVMLEQFRLYFNIENDDIAKTMRYKINRQIDRIKEG